MEEQQFRGADGNRDGRYNTLLVCRVELLHRARSRVLMLGVQGVMGIVAKIWADGSADVLTGLLRGEYWFQVSSKPLSLT